MFGNDARAAVKYREPFPLPDQDTPQRQLREEARLRNKLVHQQKMEDQILAEEKARAKFSVPDRHQFMSASQALMEDSEYRRHRRQMQRDLLDLRQELRQEQGLRRKLEKSRSDGELLRAPVPGQPRRVLFDDGGDYQPLPPRSPPLPPRRAAPAAPVQAAPIALPQPADSVALRAPAGGITPVGMRRRIHRVPSLNKLPFESPSPWCGRHSVITQPRQIKQSMSSASLQNAGHGAALALISAQPRREEFAPRIGKAIGMGAPII